MHGIYEKSPAFKLVDQKKNVNQDFVCRIFIFADAVTQLHVKWVIFKH